VLAVKAASIEKTLGPFKHLFWKTQIGLLRACPPLCGVVSKYSLGAAHSSKVWTTTLFQLAAEMPRAVLAHCRDRRAGRVVLSRISLYVTTRCTLRCDKCAVNIPDFRRRRDMPLDELTEDIQLLLSCVDSIYAVILAGGEAFLHPDLDAIIRLCADLRKIGSVSVQTNGTILPGANLLEALRDTKTLVKISKYPSELQPEVEKLKHILDENAIQYTHESAAFWNDMGAYGQRQAGSEKRRFSVCIQQLCLPYLGGKLYRCGAAAALAENGHLPGCKGEYIDLRATGPAAFRAQWGALVKKRASAACSYCLGQTYRSPRVPVAVQRMTP